jgi:glutathione synthase/RimK-type ligase-like ATP-grasp enzyme
VVYKAFSGTERTWRETRVLKLEEVALLDAVHYAPVIFQGYIPAVFDLRVTIVGGAVFAAEIHSQTTAYKHDFRMTMHEAEIRAHALPDLVAAKLLALMDALGLVYGALDLRLTPEGDYVFLEINPAGQWLFIEQRTGQPISDAIADAPH